MRQNRKGPVYTGELTDAELLACVGLTSGTLGSDYHLRYLVFLPNRKMDDEEWWKGWPKQEKWWRTQYVRYLEIARFTKKIGGSSFYSVPALGFYWESPYSLTTNDIVQRERAIARLASIDVDMELSRRNMAKVQAPNSERRVKPDIKLQPIGCQIMVPAQINRTQIQGSLW